MAARIDVPDVGNFFLRQGLVKALGGFKASIFVAAGNPQQAQLLGRGGRILDEIALPSEQCGGESANVGERVQMLQADRQPLPGSSACAVLFLTGL